MILQFDDVIFPFSIFLDYEIQICLLCFEYQSKFVLQMGIIAGMGNPS